MTQTQGLTIFDFCMVGVHAFLSYSAVTLNIITIIALRKTSQLPKPLKTMLLSLVVSDLGVGLVAEPLYTAALLVVGPNNSGINSARMITMNLLCTASLLGVTALSADRFLAIHLHLRYQELVTYKRTVAVLISIWLLSTFVSVLSHWIPRKASLSIYVAISLLCLIFTALVYFKIYLVVRYHLNPIHALQVVQEQEVAQNGVIGVMANSARQRKSAVATFYLYLVFLVCYLPNISIIVAFLISGRDTDVQVLLNILADALVFLNSTLNPLIYCWKMKHIRHTIMDILRNIVCVRSRNP